MYRTIPPSSTLLLNEQSRALALRGKEVFRFGFGQSPFPVCSTLKEALVTNAHRKEYTDVQGLKALREQVAQYHASFEQRTIYSDQIFIAPGSKALLYTIMCAYQRAAVIIPAPAWVSYAPQAQLIGHKTFLVQTDYEQSYRVTPQKLEEVLQQAKASHDTLLVVLNSPGNPDGLCYTDDELKALAEILKQHEAMVISDEIYGPLHHDNQHVSMAKHYPQGTFVTSGLSKWAGAGGWRLGIAILPSHFPEQLKMAMLGVASETYSCAAAPIQHAAMVAYSHDAEIDTYVAHQRAILKGIGTQIHSAIVAAGLRAHAPQGGFYMLVDFTPFQSALREKGWATDQQICTQLLQETGVALLPGQAFGLPAEALCARLAFVDFDGEQALKDICHQGWNTKLTEMHAAKMRRGVQLMDEFLRNL